MNANKLQAVAAAFLLSTAAIGAGALLATVPAYAQGVRPEVGQPLQAAEAAAAKGDYKGAMDDVNKAEAVSSKTSAESSATAQVVAQSYYLSGNKAGCIKYVKGLGDADETTLQLEMKCAYDTNDDADQQDALEQLVAKTGKA